MGCILIRVRYSGHPKSLGKGNSNLPRLTPFWAPGDHSLAIVCHVASPKSHPSGAGHYRYPGTNTQRPWDFLSQRFLASGNVSDYGLLPPPGARHWSRMHQLLGGNGCFSFSLTGITSQGLSSWPGGPSRGNQQLPWPSGLNLATPKRILSCSPRACLRPI